MRRLLPLILALAGCSQSAQQPPSPAPPKGVAAPGASGPTPTTPAVAPSGCVRETRTFVGPPATNLFALVAAAKVPAAEGARFGTGSDVNCLGQLTKTETKDALELGCYLDQRPDPDRGPPAFAGAAALYKLFGDLGVHTWREPHVVGRTGLVKCAADDLKGSGASCTVTAQFQDRCADAP